MCTHAAHLSSHRLDARRSPPTHPNNCLLPTQHARTAAWPQCSPWTEGPPALLAPSASWPDLVLADLPSPWCLLCAVFLSRTGWYLPTTMRWRGWRWRRQSPLWRSSLLAFLKIVWPSTGLHHHDILLWNTYIYVRRHDDVLDETSSNREQNNDDGPHHSSCALRSPK